MAAQKKKKAPSRRKRTGAKRASARRKGSFFKKAFGALFLLLLVAVLALAAAYQFGSFEFRRQIESGSIRSLYAWRSAQWMPAFVARPLASLEDRIPGNEGFAVDAGELGREASHFLAGFPLTTGPVHVLRNTSYDALYDTRQRQALCIAVRLTGQASQEKSAMKSGYRADPRVPTVGMEALSMGKWSGYPIVPVEALGKEFGQSGLNESRLSSCLVPMETGFAENTWASLMRELSIHYPGRFDEIWLYAGPVYREESSKLASDILIPDAFFAVVLDQTKAGGLRAISFLVPVESTGDDLSEYVTSMSRIETLTGLKFLPELRPHTRQSLANWASPRLW